MRRSAMPICLAAAAACQLTLAPAAAHAQTTPLRPSLPLPPPPGRNPIAPLQGPVVTVQADRQGAGLQQLQHRWTTVCYAPCRLALSPSTPYRVGGPGLRPTEPFWLPRPSGDVLVNAQLGARGRYWAGFGMLVGGLPLAATGLFWLLLASSFRNDSSGPGAGAYVAGFMLLGAGAGLSIAGYGMWSANRSIADVR